MNRNDLQKLKRWFLSQQRDLPWRDSPTPYAVWISEVMLQQTQVSVVIPYFQRWMQHFPTIRHFAQATIEEVLKEWEGLGYYARARNLHAGAKYCVEHFNGELPSSAELLGKIKGLGPYTIGAILNFAFHQRMPAVDGNVMRVISRYYQIFDDIGKTKTLKEIQYKVAALLPMEEPWIISEALIELGATVCTRKPKCMECPLRLSCAAYNSATTDQLPVKAGKTTTTQLYRAVGVLAFKDKLLVRKGEKGKVMADLYEFPYIELQGPGREKESLESHLGTFGLKAAWQQALPPVKHSFTRFQALLQPHFFNVKNHCEVEGYSWHSIESLQKMPFSAGHKRIFANLQAHAIEGSF